MIFSTSSFGVSFTAFCTILALSFESFLDFNISCILPLATPYVSSNRDTITG
jgi:hypothetical protein